MRIIIEKLSKFIPLLVGFGVVLPMFFTLSGGLYRSSAVLTDSGGVVNALPLPISILTCGVAVLCFLPRILEAKSALWTIFWMIFTLVISYFLAGEPDVRSDRKSLAFLQTILPFAGLLVGQLLKDTSNYVAKSFLVVLILVVPFQLFGSMGDSPWLNEGSFLSDQVGFFTIYSHIQFVSLIFVCAFVFFISQLFDDYKSWSLVLCALMFFYVLKSWSFLTMGAFICFLFAFLFFRGYLKALNIKHCLAVIVFIVLTSVGLATSFDGEGGQKGLLWNITGASYSKIRPLIDGKMPQNLQERIDDWRRFGGGVLEGPKTFFVGHAQPMPREVRSSAHNWYIDTAYTFGIVAVIPVLGLLLYSGGCVGHTADLFHRRLGGWWALFSILL